MSVHKTIYDQSALLYTRLKGSGIENLISGKVYDDNRPNGSQLEDIVINSVNSGSGDVQRGLSNINIYVKDIVQSESLTQANTARLKQITDVVLGLTEQVYGGFYKYRVDMVSKITEKGTGFSYTNIRIEFTFYKSQF